MEKFTDREKEIFELLGEGLPLKTVAARLGIQFSTAATHGENMCKKFGLLSLHDLMVHAIREKCSRVQI